MYSILQLLQAAQLLQGLDVLTLKGVEHMDF